MLLATLRPAFGFVASIDRGTSGGPYGYLVVTILPQEAVEAGATYSVDGVAGSSWGWGVVTAGTHLIHYSCPVPGWQPPPDEYVVVNPAQLSEDIGWNYQQATVVEAAFTRVTGSLKVTLDPVLALGCGAQWQIDGGEWMDSGAAVSGIMAGSHVVAFRDLDGWLTPTSRVVSVAGNVTNCISASYVGGKVSPISINGSGSVSPSVAGRLLQVSKSYTVTASPAPGWLFAGWSGSLTTGKPRITFTLLPDTTLRANFVQNPFGAVKGVYSGVFCEAENARHESSGFLKLQLSGMGAYTGTLLCAGKSNVFSGRFDVLGGATNIITVKGSSSTELRMNLDLSPEAGVLTGTVARNGWWSALRAERCGFNTTTNRAPYAGAYTLLLGKQDSEANADQGMGYATVRLSPGGTVRLTGRMPDGTILTHSGSIWKNGDWPMYLPLYKKEGSIFGWLKFVDGSEDYDLTGELLWTRPANPASLAYPEGFSDEVTCNGCRYVPPANGSPVIASTTNIITFMSADPGAEFTNPFLLRANNRVTNLGTNKLVMGFELSSGVITGKVAVPFSGEVLSFRGVVLQKLSAGGGYFIHSGRSGCFLINPR